MRKALLVLCLTAATAAASYFEQYYRNLSPRPQAAKALRWTGI